MINLVKIISSAKDHLNRTVVKFYRYGISDVQTSLQANPYGIDSNPVKDMIAVYAQTGEIGKTVLLGYFNKDVLTDPGETRIFSTDSEGNLQTSIHLKNNGIIEIGGNSNHLVRYWRFR